MCSVLICQKYVCQVCSADTYACECVHMVHVCGVSDCAYGMLTLCMWCVWLCPQGVCGVSVICVRVVCVVCL